MKQDAGKKRVNREVPAPQAMIETAVNRKFVTIRHQWLQQRGVFVPFTGLLREKMFLLESQQIAHSDKTSRVRLLGIFAWALGKIRLGTGCERC